MKLNVSMDFIKPLGSTLKKYSALLPSVVITVVALLLFLPTMMVNGKVKENMKKSAQTASSLSSLMNPPSKYQPEKNKGYMDTMEQELNQIQETAKHSSQRDLVNYDYILFPKPTDPSSQVYTEFGKSYRQAVEGLFKKINASDAPSDSEIQAKTGGAGQAAGYGQKQFDAANPMVDALCQTRAQEISVYANPSAFKWYDFWKKYEFSGKDKALEDCWDSQVAFWVYQDVVDTIEKLNGTSAKVLSAPVKRLLGISFTGPVEVEKRGGMGYGGMSAMGIRDIPNYVSANQISNFLDPSPTAREGNDDVDIVHFAVSVLLDYRSMMPFMKELCSEKLHTYYPSVFEEPFEKQGDPVESRHNQITILQSDVKVIDKADAQHNLYRYGKGAVVQLNLICEYQFDRQAYDAIKPEPIKKRLNQLPDASKKGVGKPASNPVRGMPM